MRGFRRFASTSGPAVNPPKKSSFGRKLLFRGAVLTALGTAGAYNYVTAQARDNASQRGDPVEDSTLGHIFNTFPLRAASRVWGAVNQIELPIWARAPVYNAWTYVFGCNLDEMRDPLESYPNLAAFFARHVKDDARPIGDAEMVCPSDGVLTVCGKLDEEGRIEQVKGVSYPAAPFLGFEKMPKGNFYYCVLYLAPGDYHRIHSPVESSFFRLTHIAGQLFPVASFATTRIPNLFCRNERAVLWGNWKHGMFSVVPVGAYNVGSIAVTHKLSDAFRVKDEYITNSTHRDVGIFSSYTKSSVPVDKGEEVAAFQLGSTVVLVFEVPAKSEFEFTPTLGSKVKMGESLGKVVKS